MSVLNRWQQALGLSLLCCVPLSAGTVSAQDFTVPRIVELRAPGAQKDFLIQVNGPPKYWVGVFCRPVDEALRTQLQLPAGQGVVVDGVAPDSPAAKAGLREHDVLVSVGDKTLANPADLLKLIEGAEGNELDFKLIRKGKSLTLGVTPADRPEQITGEAYQLPRQNLDPLRTWIDRLNDPAHGPLHLRGFGPGVMFGQRALPKLPDGVSIQINKTGQEPAKIVVTRGDEKWELTDEPEQLAKLPDELRPAVEGLLGHGFPSFQVRVPGSADAVGGVAPLPPEGEQAASDVEQRLREVEQRLEKLLNELKSKSD